MAKSTITIKFNKEVIHGIEDLVSEAIAALFRTYGLDDIEYRKPKNNEGLMELDERYESTLAEIVKNVIK